jgi:Ser/Thr protein kinase RdoA (MazF antagonist)
MVTACRRPDAAGRERRLRLTTWLVGTLWVDASQRGTRSAASLGRLLARLDRSLAAFHHPAATSLVPGILQTPRRGATTRR